MLPDTMRSPPVLLTPAMPVRPEPSPTKWVAEMVPETSSAVLGLEVPIPTLGCQSSAELYLSEDNSRERNYPREAAEPPCFSSQKTLAGEIISLAFRGRGYQP
jgi:hypothetical protein